jgi:hypothetical protein
MEDAVTLFRPTGPRELQLVAATGFRRWPPRLQEQPIFYPVTNEAYASHIAERWNVPESGAGFVTRFAVEQAFMHRYERRVVGAAEHEEYWIPAEDLEALNDAIVGEIEVVSAFGVFTPDVVPGLRLAENRIEFSGSRPALPSELAGLPLVDVATLAASFVSWLSEEFWAAGWLHGAGRTCLNASMGAVDLAWGHGTFDAPVRDDLARLRARLEPWWVEWKDEWGGVSVVPALSLVGEDPGKGSDLFLARLATRNSHGQAEQSVVRGPIVSST